MDPSLSVRDRERTRTLLLCNMIKRVLETIDEFDCSPSQEDAAPATHEFESFMNSKVTRGLHTASLELRVLRQEAADFMVSRLSKADQQRVREMCDK